MSDILSTTDLVTSISLLGAEPEDKKHQVFRVTIASELQRLKWSLNMKFMRLRQLNTVLAATAADSKLIALAQAFPEHHHTSATHRVWWLSKVMINESKAQEQRRALLEQWLNEILANHSILAPACRMDLLDMIDPKSAGQSSSSTGGSGRSQGSSESSAYSISPFRPTRRSSLLSGSPQSSSPKSSSGASPPPGDAAIARPDAVTKAWLALELYIQSKILHPHGLSQTSVTCVSRTGTVIAQSSVSISGDVFLAVSRLVTDIGPWALLVGCATLPLCSQDRCLGLTLQRAWAFQLFVASAVLFFILRWRGRFLSVLEAARAGLPAQEALRLFCGDEQVVYSLEPVLSRYRFSSLGGSTSGTGSDGDALSPRSRAMRSKTRSASMATRDLSSSTFDRFEFDDIEPEAKKHYWDSGSDHHFSLRGVSYMDDNTKEHPGPALFKLMLMELYEVEPQDGERHDHVASMGLARKRIEAISSLPGKPFIFVINFQIPGDPPVSMVAFFAMPPNILDRYPGMSTEKFVKLFKNFAKLGTEEERLASWGIHSDSPAPSGGGGGNGGTGGGSGGGGGGGGGGGSSWLKVPSDIQWPSPQEPGAYPQSDFRNKRIKLIANITDGPWVIKTAVPNKPALLGKKLVCRYFGGDNYVEVDLHVGSSIIAAQVTSLCRGLVKQFAADLAIVIQGEDEGELPERVLGCLHIHKIDLELRRRLWDEEEDSDDAM